jgi:hypothetical protein
MNARILMAQTYGITTERIDSDNAEYCRTHTTDTAPENWTLQDTIEVASDYLHSYGVSWVVDDIDTTLGIWWVMTDTGMGYGFSSVHFPSCRMDAVNGGV